MSQLLRAGASAGRKGEISGCTPLHAAALAGNAGACRELLAAGCKPDVHNASRRSALYLACIHGLPEVAEALVAGGADPYAARAAWRRRWPLCVPWAAILPPRCTRPSTSS